MCLEHWAVDIFNFAVHSGNIDHVSIAYICIEQFGKYDSLCCSISCECLSTLFFFSYEFAVYEYFASTSQLDAAATAAAAAANLLGWCLLFVPAILFIVFILELVYQREHNGDRYSWKRNDKNERQKFVHLFRAIHSHSSAEYSLVPLFCVVLESFEPKSERLLHGWIDSKLNCAIIFVVVTNRMGVRLCVCRFIGIRFLCMTMSVHYRRLKRFNINRHKRTNERTNEQNEWSKKREKNVSTNDALG